MFEDINQHRAAVAENIQKAMEIGFTGGELEKAKHQVGDIHPNGQWVWTRLPSGREDWRKINRGSGAQAKSENSDSNKVKLGDFIDEKEVKRFEELSSSLGKRKFSKEENDEFWKIDKKVDAWFNSVKKNKLSKIKVVGDKDFESLLKKDPYNAYFVDEKDFDEAGKKLWKKLGGNHWFNADNRLEDVVFDMMDVDTMKSFDEIAKRQMENKNLSRDERWNASSWESRIGAKLYQAEHNPFKFDPVYKKMQGDEELDKWAVMIDSYGFEYADEKYKPANSEKEYVVSKMEAYNALIKNSVDKYGVDNVKKYLKETLEVYRAGEINAIIKQATKGNKSKK